MFGPRASIASITHSLQSRILKAKCLGTQKWREFGVAEVAGPVGPVNVGGQLNRQKDSTHRAH